MSQNSGKSTNKTLLVLSILVIVAAVIFFVKSSKGTVVGTWAYTTDPDQTLTIYKNGSAQARGGSENLNTWKWTYEDDTLTLYPDDSLNNNTIIYTVVLDGDTMSCTTPGGYTATFTRVSK